MSVDLHCHTKLSNSSMGIDDLIMLAKKRGVDTISITDHDCQAGSVRGRIIAARRGVTVVPGVELSASDAETGRPDTYSRLLLRQSGQARRALP